nr:Coenzyme F420 hydrogenase/dehydrogenase, beta subunit C-terminal domain [Erythrobacter sp. F6033]
MCSGCGLCAGIGNQDQPGIEMGLSEQGYRRPKRIGDVSADHARKIDQVCPGVNIRHEPESFEATYSPTWGPVIKARLGWSSDEALRYKASSGGGLSAILLHLIESGEIDYVLQTSVAADSPIRNAITVSSDREGVMLAAGSRYAPSSPLEDIGSRLDEPRRFAFVGKPCDVAGLRQLARHDPRVDEKVPFMISFMCAGVPSYSGTSDLLEQMGVSDESEVEAFRYRGEGWPGNATAKMKDGSTRSMDYDTSWGRILNRHLQFRCKICADGIGEFADIVCADGWYCDADGNPMFDENHGRSIVLTRTNRGEALVARAIKAGKLVAEPVELEEIIKMQPYQSLRKGLVFFRLAALALLRKPRPRYEKLEMLSGARAFGVVAGLRNFFGMLRRSLSDRGPAK